nr:immunoglobulin heavy chain junction region [Mus musculus]
CARRYYGSEFAYW